MGRLTESDYQALAEICPGGVFRNVALAKISQWRIGGCADLVLQPGSTEQVSAVLQWFSARGFTPVVIGLTSNLLFDDAGLRAPCIQIGPRIAGVRVEGAEVYAGAGVWVPSFARQLMQAGLGGAEHICGIPGTLGGLICMNGGSQRKGIGSAVITVESVDHRGAIHERSAEDCAFSYRRSVFQTNGEIITSSRLSLTPRSRANIRAEMLAILANRRRKFPRKEPNCGSVFKSNPTMYAEIGPPGAAIERLGFKGYRVGGAMVSPHHANFIVNAGGATTRDVLTLIARISNAVQAATGYRMEVEACFVRADGAIQPADTALLETGVRVS